MEFIGGVYNILGQQNYYYDGYSEGITNHLPTSAYYLDGQRLIRTDSTASKLSYKTETGNTKAFAHINNNKIDSFEVWHPNGIKNIYKEFDDFAFYLTKSVNATGNEITYYYETTNFGTTISRIIYGETQEGNIYFNSQYNINTDYPYYRNGKTYIPKQITGIESFVSDSLYSSYFLEYNTKDEIPYLKKITRNSNLSYNKTQNPVIFYYGDSTANNSDINWNTYKYTFFKEDHNSTINLSELRCEKGKFDYGTGNDAIALVEDKLSYNSSNKNQYTGNEVIRLLSLCEDSIRKFNPIYTEEGFIKCFFIDLDNNEGEEFILVNNTIDTKNNNAEEISFRVITQENNAIKHLYTRTYTFTDYPNINFAIPKYFSTGDFNGDGRMDVLFVTANNISNKGNISKCYLCDLENDTVFYVGEPFIYNKKLASKVENEYTDGYLKSDKLFTFDYDGDGKTDICHINDEGTDIYSFKNGETGLNCTKINNTYTEIKNTEFSSNNPRQLMLGEFNNDGLTDILLSPKSGSNDLYNSLWKVYINKGDGGWDYNGETNIAPYKSGFSYMLHDVNEDGFSDMIGFHPIAEGTLVYFYIIKNMQITMLESGIHIPNNITGNKVPAFVPTNLESRNCYNCVLSLFSDSIAKIYLNNNDHNSRMLTGISAGNGVMNKYSYKSLSDNSQQIFTKGNGAKFPYFNYKGNLRICDRSVTLLNGNALSDTRYMYVNAVGHKQGLGFLGFEEFAVHDAIRNDTSIVYFADTCHFRVPQRIVTTKEDVRYFYNINIANDRTAKVELEEKDTYDKIHQSNEVISYEYDAYGNVTSEHHTFEYTPDNGDLNTDYAYRTITTYKNLNNSSTYFLGLPLTTTTTTSNGTSKDVKRIVYTYNTYGQPLTKTYAQLPASAASNLLRAAPSTDNNNTINKETYTYDSMRRLNKKAVKKYNSPYTLDETYTYYDNGALQTRTNELGLTERYVYDACGRLKEQYDHKNNVTKYYYDGWNRNIRTVKPGMSSFPQITKYAYTKVTDNVPGALTKVTITEKYEDVEYYDTLGRKIKSVKERFDGQNLCQEWQYDILGREIRESYPYKPGNTIRWKNKSYDNFDRLKTTTFPDGRCNTIAYSGYTTLSFIDSVYIKTEKNPLEQLLYVDHLNEDTGEDFGIVWYNYLANGQLSSINSNDKYNISYMYDEFGRRTYTNDPSSGNEYYTYTAGGELKSETDANGYCTEYTYDRYGRVTEKAIQVFDNITTYTYTNDGLLTCKNSNDNHKIYYSYDNLGRIIHEKEVMGNNLSVSRKYNYHATNGNILSTIDSVNNEEVARRDYIYDTSGKFLRKIMIGNIVVWQRNKENSFGNITEEITGALKRTYSYDAYGNPLSRQVKIKDIATGDSLCIQNFAYNFSSATGNLLSRSDIVNGKNETFEYDNIGRLISFAGNDVQYDILGNITSMDEVGVYEYQSSNPYAVTTLEAENNRIPNMPQEITFHTHGRVESIRENNNFAQFEYTSDGDRIKMTITNNAATILSRTYFTINAYEKDVTPTGTEERLYLDGDAYSATSVMTRSNGGAWSIKYICRDHLSSITHITDASGNLLQELSYDAWGNLREPATHNLYTANNQPALQLGRGYTGHEHLPLFGLVNMNARLYDPVLARFLSPDPYVHEEAGTQGYNRYSYCLNNPLKYTDESGEIFFSFMKDFFVNTFIRSWKEGINAWTDSKNWRTTKNSLKITSGLFAGTFKQTISRLTWELPQTIMGFTYAYTMNNLNLVKDVDQYRGATVTTLKTSKGAVTLGSYITGNKGLKAEVGNNIFMHEYGHYLQSQDAGYHYLLNYGLPSLLSCGNNHNNSSVEQDANARAYKHFYKRMDGKMRDNFLTEFPIKNIKSYYSYDELKKYNSDDWHEILFKIHW